MTRPEHVRIIRSFRALAIVAGVVGHWGTFMTQKAQVRLEAPFFCKNLREEVHIEKCLDTFVEANAFSMKESTCYKCPQGQRVRNLIARS